MPRKGRRRRAGSNVGGWQPAELPAALIFQARPSAGSSTRRPWLQHTSHFPRPPLLLPALSGRPTCSGSDNPQATSGEDPAARQAAVTAGRGPNPILEFSLEVGGRRTWGGRPLCVGGLQAASSPAQQRSFGSTRPTPSQFNRAAAAADLLAPNVHLPSPLLLPRLPPLPPHPPA
jgi:hypothetical protein